MVPGRFFVFRVPVPDWGNGMKFSSRLFLKMTTLYWVIQRAFEDLCQLSTQFPIEFECVNPTTFLIHHWYHKDMFLRLDIRSEIPNRYFNSQLSYRIMFYQKLRAGSCKYSTLHTNIPITLLSSTLAETIADHLTPYSLLLKDELLSRHKKTTKPLSLISFYHLCTNDIFVWNHYTVPEIL